MKTQNTVEAGHTPEEWKIDQSQSTIRIFDSECNTMALIPSIALPRNKVIEVATLLAQAPTLKRQRDELVEVVQGLLRIGTTATSSQDDSDARFFAIHLLSTIKKEGV